MKRDRWVFSGVYGEGLGRYLLGIQATAGSIIDPVNNELKLRDNWAVLTTCPHHLTEALGSTAMIGYAKSTPLSWQPDDTLESSTYAAANTMWQVLPGNGRSGEKRYEKKEVQFGYTGLQL